MSSVHTLWLRAETKPNEQRCAIVPSDAEKLLSAGLNVVVEDSPQGCFSADAYKAVGCTIVDAGTWITAPKDNVIVGIKELPEDNTPLEHRHIFFGHAYKDQDGAGQFLARFQAGGGILWDWEFLHNPQGQRIITFGYWAGFAGALVAVRMWLTQQGQTLPDLVSTSRARAIALLKIALDDHQQCPRAMIMGALGRCGRGAAGCFAELGIACTGWDKAETATAGPYNEILTHEIFLNAVLAAEGMGVFLNASSLEAAIDRQLSVIVDVSCDPNSPYNPLPIYNKNNSFNDPVQRLAYESKPPLDLSAIDHLPSLLPQESSMDFSAQALPYLLELYRNPNAEPWLSCYNDFVSASAKY